MDLQQRFTVASEEVQRLQRKPEKNSLLSLYAFYKQATVGDISTKRPGLLDPVGRAKWDAWSAVKGKSTLSAMEDYVSLVDGLKKEVGVRD